MDWPSLFGDHVSNFWLVFDLAILIYWIAVSVLIISEDREPTAALAWLLVLFAVPFLGLVVYFLFGRNWPAIIQKAPVTKRLQGLLGGFMPSVYDTVHSQRRSRTESRGTGSPALSAWSSGRSAHHRCRCAPVRSTAPGRSTSMS